MASIFSHPAVPLALHQLLPKQHRSVRALVAGIALSIAPDLDAIGFWMGVPYGSMAGHRGITHSFVFAVILSSIITRLLLRASRVPSPKWPVHVFLAISAASHGVLDAFTNGGLGIAFLAPFSAERFFMPWTPISVSPIGISAFFSDWGLAVLESELVYVWLPAAMIAALGVSIHRKDISKSPV